MNQKYAIAAASLGLTYGLYKLCFQSKEFSAIALKEMIIKCYKESIQLGFVEPFDVKQTFSKNEQGIEFHIKLVKSLAKKPTHDQKDIDPLIAPFQPGQLVTSISNYNILLNKYPVNPYHILLVPKAFIHQTEKFSREYLSLSYDVLKAVEGFAFFNSHKESGASLQHKHMQIVTSEALQSANILNHVWQWSYESSSSNQQRFIRLKYLKRIKHYIMFFDQELISGQVKDKKKQEEIIYKVYEALLQKFKVEKIENFKHNLIMTSHFMMIVARKSANSHGVSLNAVGFTGSLLAKNEEELEKLKNIKIIEILENLAESDVENQDEDVIEC